MLSLIQIEQEAKAIAALQLRVKTRAMIYQVEDKERLAIKRGLPFDTYFNLPFSEWMERRKASSSF